MTVLLAEKVKQVVSEELPTWIEEQPDLRLRLQQAIGKIPGEPLRPFGYAQDRQAQGRPPSRMTYEEFLDWADEDTLAEWVDGEVVMYSPASKQHQLIVGFLEKVLGTFVEQHNLGVVLSG